VDHQADYLLALKGNQPTLEAKVDDYFGSAPAKEVVSKIVVEKGHGRIETPTYTDFVQGGLDRIRKELSG
jgi:hypothetical protein